MTFEEYIRWLLSGGEAWSQQDPYAPAPMPGSAVGGMLPTYDYGDLGDQGKALNIAQDYADVGSDPAFLGGFYGEMPTAAMYESKPNPGYTMLTNAAAMEGTIEQLIADEILNGGSAGSAMTKIQALIEAGDESIPIPTYTDDMGASKPDLDYVKDVATKFQEAYLSDTTPGTPGTEEPISGSLAEWYAKTGTPLPNQSYTQEDLATPEQLDFLANRKQLGAASDANLQAMREMVGWDRTPIEGAGGKEYQRVGWIDGSPRQANYEIPEGNYADPRGRTGASQAPVYGQNGAIYGDYFYPNNEPGGGIAAPRRLTDEEANRPKPQTTADKKANRQQSVKKYNDRARQPLSAGLTAMRDAGTAWAEQAQREIESEKARKEREQIAAVLAQQGHTPYNDTMAYRRMMSQYMGFGI
jgi:hypothetical protein